MKDNKEKSSKKEIGVARELLKLDVDIITYDLIQEVTEKLKKNNH